MAVAKLKQTTLLLCNAPVYNLNGTIPFIGPEIFHQVDARLVVA